MPKAKKLPSGNYRVRAYLGKNADGKDIYKSFTAPTKKEAEFLAASFSATAKRPTEKTVKTLIEEYIDAKSSVLSPTTIAGYESMLKITLSRLCELKVSEINKRNVQDAVNELTVSLSPKTVHNAYGLFSAALNWADVPNVKITLPPKTRQFKRLPTADIVINTFKGSEIEIPVLLAIWQGMRCSEILGVRKCDIDKDGILTISQVGVTVDGKILYKKRAKTYGSNRQLMLPPQIVSLIRSVDCPDTMPVVSLTRKQIYLRFIKGLANTGYKITFHDLRHINASVMAALGIPDIYAMERGGWSNTTTLRSVYQQTFDSERQKVDKAVDNYFNEIYGLTQNMTQDIKKCD